MKSGDDYLNEVRAYYEETTPLYLNHVGSSIQSALLDDDERTSNLKLAKLAQISDGEIILDAGCGVMGPAIDIASRFDVTIEGVTLSPMQARIGHENIYATQTDRVKVILADFHSLPLPNNRYDSVIFLESAGYACDMTTLFSETYRVIKPGGRLFIKDIFLREGELTDYEIASLADFNRIYVYKTKTISETLEVMNTVGFRTITTEPLNTSQERSINAMLTEKRERFSPFGTRHFTPYRYHWGTFHYILAYK